MKVGITRLMFEANVGDPPKLIVEFIFGEPFNKTCHKAAAINAWLTNGQLEINYDDYNDQLVFTKS